MRTRPVIELLFFKGDQCSVCGSLLPKIDKLLKDKFKDVFIKIIDINKSPQVASNHFVFSLPVVIILVDGKEYERFARSFSILEIEKKLNRIISLIDD